MKAQISDEELVRVTSIDEIRPGITVLTKTCLVCGKVHVFIILDLEKDQIGIRAYVEPPWTHSSWSATIGDHIDAGRLYRLRDLDFRREARLEIECDLDDAKRKIDAALEKVKL